MTSTSPLKVLGRTTPLPASPAEAYLEGIPNPHPGDEYYVRLTCPEFTSLCPITGQPDFAIIVVDYSPGDWLIESKTFKLFMGSFRNHGAYHEDCVITIGKRLEKILNPTWLRVSGYFNARGGIPIDVFWEFGQPFHSPPAMPPHNIDLYKGR